jgi:P-type Cu+ transporter
MAPNMSNGQETAYMAATTVKVDGMTCGACTSSIESGFKGINGVASVSVNLVMGRAVIHHDPTKLSPEKVAEIIEDRGFDAEVLSTIKPTQDVQQSHPVSSSSGLKVKPISQISTTTLAVSGMTCGACTSSIEAGFKDVPGVKSMSVSLLSGRAVVEHDASVIGAAALAEIVEDRGFDATVIDSKAHEVGDKAATGESNDSKGDEVAVTTVAIDGMTCGACTSAVEGAFKDISGLIRFNISLLAGRAVISHETSKLTAERIIELIEDAGFDAQIISSQSEGAQHMPSTSTVRLKIYGLHDGLAAKGLEDSLRSKAGITGAVISLSTSRATVNYNTALIGLRTIVQSVEDAGYNALVADSDDNNAQLESLAKTKEIQEWKKAFLFSLSFAVPVFCISMLIPMFVPALNFGALRLIPGLYLGDLVSCVLTIPVQFGIGKRFYISAWKSLKHRSPTMDVLVVLGTSAAFFFSVFAVLIAIFIPPHNKPGTVFDTSTMLITFITLGRWLENRAKGQTSKALSNLMSLAPSMATIYEDPLLAEKLAEAWTTPLSPTHTRESSLVTPLSPTHTNDISFTDAVPANGGQVANQKTIPTELIEVGDIVILRPGDKVPADGTVTRGDSYVDESMVTGEPMPILKKKGSLLIAGTVNGAGRVDFRVTRAGKDTQLSQIVNLVQEAQTSRAPIQRMADLVAGYFVPIIIGLGLITFVSWMILSHILPHPPKIFVDNQSGGKFMVCLKLCISVIVFACPCALGLATPTAVMVGTGTASQQGILVKGGAALETATRITHIVLDKTGTLTVGRLNVAETRMEPTWNSNEWRSRLWWTLVGLAEMGSEHPVGRAILTAAKENLHIGQEDTIPGGVGNFKVTVGRGISATIEPNSSGDQTRYEVSIGNAYFLRGKGIHVPETAESASLTTPSLAKSTSTGITSIHIAINKQYAGTLGLSDTLKPTAPAAITALHKMGISTSLITGDTYDTAVAIAQLVGIPKDSIRASVSPAEKQSIISELQAQGECVAMVGDGINDSPALATADVGIGLVSGSDIAVEAADIVIMRPEDLLNVPAALCLCRTIFKRIKLNLLWACGYNFIGLPFAMGIFLPFGYMMPPMLAGAAMALSSVCHVFSPCITNLNVHADKLGVRYALKSRPEMVKAPEVAKCRDIETRF